MGSRALRITTAEIGSVGTISPATAVTSTTTMHAVSILTAVALVVAVWSGILLRLRATAGDECRETTQFLPGLLATLTWLLMGLLLMLRTIVNLLIARRKRLGIARQIGLLLRFARSVAGLVLAHERLRLVIVAIESIIGPRLPATLALLLRLLLIVVRVLLAELFLRGGDQAEVMLGMLIVILGGYRIAGPLRVACKLNVFFCDMRCGAADLYIGTVRFINAR